MKKISIVFVEMYSVLFSFKRVLSHAGIFINEKFSWYLPSFSFFHLNPIRFVSCFITVFSFRIFDTSECQHSHYLVIEKITFSFWKILLPKAWFFSFWIYIETFMYDIKNTEQLKQSLNTDWNVLTSSRENIKIILTLTGWKCSENCQISSQSLLSTNSASEKLQNSSRNDQIMKNSFPKEKFDIFSNTKSFN